MILCAGTALAKTKPCKGCYCTVSATNVNFGNYDALTKPTLYSTGTVAVSCGTDTVGDVMSYQVELNWGKKGKNPREMSGGKDALTYNLYTNATYSTIWADGKNGSVVVTDSYTFTTLCCENRNYTDYGRLDGGQNVSPGVYVDDIVVTVSW